MTKVAADLRARAVNGEDPESCKSRPTRKPEFREPTPTRRWKVRRDTLPPQHEAVMDLKPGEVSKVF